MRTSALVVLLLGCVSCASPGNWSYAPEAPKTRQPVMNVSVGVPAAVDRRSDENHECQLISAIPLMPYGWEDFSRPETSNIHLISGQWQFQPTVDISKAVAAELQSSGLFKEAFLAERPTDGDLTLQITINSLHYESKTFSYCISVAGPLLWFFLPAGTVDNDISLAFELKDRSGKMIWSGESKRDFESGGFWIYSVPSDFRYDNLLKEILMQDVLPALEKLPAQS